MTLSSCLPFLSNLAFKVLGYEAVILPIEDVLCLILICLVYIQLLLFLLKTLNVVFVFVCVSVCRPSLPEVAKPPNL